MRGETITLKAGSVDEILQRQRKEKPPVVTMALSAGLLRVSARGLSFATPGHRSGRSYGLTGKLLRCAT